MRGEDRITSASTSTGQERMWARSPATIKEGRYHLAGIRSHMTPQHRWARDGGAKGLSWQKKKKFGGREKREVILKN